MSNPNNNKFFINSFQDVLEKIRARGSTVTYYGGKVLDKRSSANGIMQDIYKNRCIACQPLNCPDPDEVNEKMNFSASSNYLGTCLSLLQHYKHM